MKIPSLLRVSPAHLVRVLDVDEEIFELYTRLAGSAESSNKFHQNPKQRPTQCGSLGFIDSGTSTIQVRLEINDDHRSKPEREVQNLQRKKTKFHGRLRSKANKSNLSNHQVVSRISKEIEVELKQDLFATKYRSGDTGSIVWRASIDFAELLWYELLLPTRYDDLHSNEEGREQHRLNHDDRYHVDDSSCSFSLFDMKLLTNSTRILELGSGTGCLSILSHSMFPSESSSTWTCSDQFQLLNNLSKNMIHNQIRFSTPTPTTDPSSQHQLVIIEEIDWLDIEKQWLKDRSDHRGPFDNSHGRQNQKLKPLSKYDLILVVDCLYNESLTGPLVRTIDYFSSSGVNDPLSPNEASPTVVLIVSELRSNEVLSGFLRDWLGLLPSWNIFRVMPQALRQDLKLNISGTNYVVWCAWKN